MAEQFDAYHKWLGISPEKQPPNLYQLLAVDEFESDPDVIEAAADQRMSHLRTYQTSKHAKLSQKLLNEISTARVTLLKPDKKAEYDQQLQQKLGSDADDPLGPSFNQLTGGTTLAGPASFASQPAPNPVGPVISTKPTIKKKPAWILPVGISVGALVILGVIITVVIVAGSNKDEPEKTVAEQDVDKQPVNPPNDNTVDPTLPEKTKDDTPTSNVVDGQQDGTKKNGETTSPLETIDDPATKTEDGTPDTATTNDASTNPVEPAQPIESEAPKKRPLPTDAQQAPVLATLEETFKLSEKRTNDEQLKLAGEFFKLAGQSTDPIEKFVLLRGTMKYAAEGGDAQLLLQAVDAIDHDFEIDRLDIAQKALIGVADQVSTEKQFGSLAEVTTQFITDAVAQDRVDLAQGLAQEVYNAAVKRTNAAAYRKQFYEQRKRVDELFTQWRQVQDAQAKLKSNPDEPDANLLVGKWKCFKKGDWESGLPLLAKGGDETLKTLADQELSLSSENVEDQLALADAWWSAAENADAQDKNNFRGRAYDWYSLAKPNVTASLDKLRIDKRLKEIGDLKRPVRAKTVAKVSRSINLFERIDLRRDYVSGKVEPTQSGIRFATNRGGSRMVIPASATGSYVLELEFTRDGSESWAVGLIFPVGDKHCTLVLSYLSGQSHGIGLIDGKPVESNGTATTPGQLEQNRRYRLELTVTRNGDTAQISASLDGTSIVKWQGKEALLSTQWTVKDQSPIAKGDFSWFSLTSTVLHSAKLRAILQPPVANTDNRTTPSEATDIGLKVPVAPRGSDGLPQLVALRPFVTEGRTPVGFLQGGRYGMRSRGGITYIVDLTTGKDVTVIRSSGQYVMAAAIAPDEKHVVVGYRRGGGPFVYSTANAQVVHELVGHVQADFLIHHLDISPDGKTVVSSGGDGTVRLWELRTGKEIHKLEVGEVSITRFLRDGHVVVGHSRTVEIWDPNNGKTEPIIAELESPVRSLAVLPAGKRFAIGLAGGEIKIFSYDKTWNVEQEIKCPEWEGLTFSQDGQRILSAGGGLLALWDVATGKKLASAAHEDVVGVALSPDGKHALSASKRNGGAILWRLP